MAKYVALKTGGKGRTSFVGTVNLKGNSDATVNSYAFHGTLTTLRKIHYNTVRTGCSEARTVAWYRGDNNEMVELGDSFEPQLGKALTRYQELLDKGVGRRRAFSREEFRAFLERYKPAGSEFMAALRDSIAITELAFRVGPRIARARGRRLEKLADSLTTA